MKWEPLCARLTAPVYGSLGNDLDIDGFEGFVTVLQGKESIFRFVGRKVNTWEGSRDLPKEREGATSKESATRKEGFMNSLHRSKDCIGMGQVCVAMMMAAICFGMFGACDRLVTHRALGEESNQFGLRARIVDLSPVSLSRTLDITPANFRFRVEGCENFSVSIRHRTSSSLSSFNAPHGQQEFEMDYEIDASGYVTIEVPLALLGPDEEMCLGDEQHPWRLDSRFVVRCENSSRELLSDWIAVEWKSASTWFRRTSRVDGVFQGTGDHDWFEWSGGELHWMRQARFSAPPDILGSPVRAAVEEFRVPQWVVGPSRAYFWVGCPLRTCEITYWEAEHGMSGTLGTYVYAYEIERSGLREIRGDDWIVPGDALDMFVDEHDVLWVLSQVGSDILLSVFEDGGASRDVRTLVQHPRESLLEVDLSAVSNFVDPSGDQSEAFFWVSNSVTHEGTLWSLSSREPRTTGPLPSHEKFEAAYLSPNATQWAVCNGSSLWVAGEGQDWVRLQEEEGCARVVWSDRLLLVWDEGGVRAYDRTDRSQLLWRHETSTFLVQNSLLSPLLKEVLLVEGLVVIRTEEDVRILNEEGELVGGMFHSLCEGFDVGSSTRHKPESLLFVEGGRALVGAGRMTGAIDLRDQR